MLKLAAQYVCKNTTEDLKKKLQQKSSFWTNVAILKSISI